MQLPDDMTKVVGGLRYATRTATVLASNAYWDGNNWERQGRNTYLCRSPRGRYFLVHLTCWQSERDSIEPVTEDEAVGHYETLPEHETPFEEAFPGRKIEDA